MSGDPTVLVDRRHVKEIEWGHDPLGHELLQEEAAGGHRKDLGALHQVRVLVAKRQQTARLEAHDGDPGTDQDIEQAVARRIALEEFTWGASMHNCEGNLELLLLVLSSKDEAAARRIRSEVSKKMVGDDSALRAQSQLRQGTVEVLKLLIIDN